MGILAQDTFAGRTVGSGWGTASDGRVWTQNNGGSIALSVSSNEGRAHAGFATTQMLLGSGTATDQEGLVRFSPGQDNDQNGLVLRSDSTSANFYYAETGGFANDISVNKVVAGTKTLLDVQVCGFTVTAGSFYWMRFQAVGTTLKCRMWIDGNTEPNTWQSTITDSTFASGQYGIFAYSFGAVDAQYDSYQANDTISAMPLATQAEAKFYVKANLQTQSRAKFLVRLALMAQARSKFLVRAKLLSGARSQFFVRSLLQAQARSKFLIRLKLATTARSTFLVRLALKAVARAAFLIDNVYTPPTITYVIPAPDAPPTPSTYPGSAQTAAGSTGEMPLSLQDIVCTLYSVNGTPLDSIPVVASVPLNYRGGHAALGSLFFLEFWNCSDRTLALLQQGAGTTPITVHFGFPGGFSATGQVLTHITTTDSVTQVILTTVGPMLISYG